MRRVLVPLGVSPLLPAAGWTLHRLGGASMGTTWTVQVVCAADAGLARRLQAQLDAQLDDVVAQMSHWESGSVLSRYNDAPAGSWHAVPAEFFAVLDYALAVADASGGAYDPCAGSLVNRWGFGARKRHDEPGFLAPSDAEVAALLARADRGRFVCQAPGRRLLQPGGLQLDLSSVAKGFAVDQLARCLHAQGLHHHLVEVGGELRGAGVKADGTPWWVTLEGLPDLPTRAGLSDLPALPDTEPTVVALHGLAVATSGDYLRYFDHQGRRASHTIDPRSGRPIDHGVASVTVLHTNCMAADALSTALSVLGAQAGLEYAERHDLAARFLLRGDGGGENGAPQEVTSSAFRAMLA